MKKLFFKVAMVVAAIIMLSSCGASHYLTTNANLQQTNVVLSQNNFHVVKNVESSVKNQEFRKLLSMSFVSSGSMHIRSMSIISILLMRKKRLS